MECDLCSRSGSSLSSVGLHCPSCARTALYLPRLDLARVLLEKMTLESKFDDITTHGGALDHNLRLAKSWRTELSRTQANDVQETLQQSQASIASVKQEIIELRRELTERRTKLDTDRGALKRVKGTLTGHDKGQTERRKDAMIKGMKNFGSIHEATVETRAYLCREAASLLRLRQRKRRTTEGSYEYYAIAGWQIPDLRDIANFKCTELTAMLSTFSHLLCLVAFYLSVRLPAEITLPRRDYPLATISTPATSYTSTKIDFPGSGSILAITEVSRKKEASGFSRPRPLFVGSDDKNELISHVAKRDPSAFKFFVEAISLLAWDVSWLCHTQGFNIGTENWGESCNMGRNLWNLIFAPQQTPALLRAASARDTRQRSGSSRTGTPSGETSSGRLGTYSHSSAHSYLASTAGAIRARAMRLTKYTMIADPLRKQLENDMKNAEWEVLGDDEILDGGENFDEAVVVRARNMDGKHYDDARSIMSTRTHYERSPNRKPTGTSGWTKLKEKSRDG